MCVKFPKAKPYDIHTSFLVLYEKICHKRQSITLILFHYVFMVFKPSLSSHPWYLSNPIGSETRTWPGHISIFGQVTTNEKYQFTCLYHNLSISSKSASWQLSVKSKYYEHNSQHGHLFGFTWHLTVLLTRAWTKEHTSS